MNAAEQARSIEYASKIAATVGAFKGQLPDLRSDLKPWANDPDTRELVDPDSIDIGFHFPGFSRSFNCRSLLVQIRLHTLPALGGHDGAERGVAAEDLGDGRIEGEGDVGEEVLDGEDVVDQLVG